MKKNNIGHYFIYFLLFISITLIYSRYISTKGLIIKEYSIINNKLPSNFHGLKIVHFSDLHYGSTIYEDELKNVVNTINDLKPNLVVFTGDLIDKDYTPTQKDKDTLIEELNKIDPELGFYHVKGNHDTTNDYNSVITKLNAIDLNNLNKEIYFNNGNTPIRLVGIDDKINGKQNLNASFNYENDLYTIAITHEPDDFDNFLKPVDVVLAGHSHNGQVRLPFIGAIYTPIGAKKYYDEKYIINNTNIFISSGIGTSTIKFRFLNKPSINFYRLYNN